MSNNNKFKPFISPEKTLPELTKVSVFLGVLLAIVFGAANAYLGLRVGMTVSSSIPAAVISMGIIRVILKRDSILENNMVQTIGSAGESLAAGTIFTIPALYMWASEGVTTVPSLLTISIIAFCGGMLGVLFMIPLRHSLIVQEHKRLPYPEGTACAKVLLAGESGISKAKKVFWGLGIAGIYKFISEGLKLFPSQVEFHIRKNYKCSVGLDVLPALVGVGYICGRKIAGYMFAGGILSWLVLMPAISFFGGDGLSAVTDGTGSFIAFNQLDSWSIWSNYIKYIGAGCVAAGGAISLIKSIPTMINTFKTTIKGFKGVVTYEKRTEKSISIKTVFVCLVVLVLAIWLVPMIPVNGAGALLIVVFGFFFATVSARMVGIVGSSNNPVSGMAIATLIVTTVLLKTLDIVGIKGMVSAICIGSVICIVAAMAGDTSQDLKTGFLVGATPKKQQIGEIIGVVASAITIGAVMNLLSYAWQFGSKELPAAQATLMKVVVEGVMGGTLPWTLILIGVFIGIVVEILGIPVLAFAVGLYLPIHLSSAIMAGGFVRWIVERRKYKDEPEKSKVVEKGILYSSGMIAGEGMVGILLAILAVTGISGNIDMSGIYGDSANIGNIFLFLFLADC